MPKTTKRKPKPVAKPAAPKVKRWLTGSAKPPGRKTSGAALKFAPVEAAQAALDRSQVADLRKLYRDTARSFRPRKSDRDSIVFISRLSPVEKEKIRKAGKRAPKFIRVERASRRRTYAVYVGPRGGKRPVPQVQRDWSRIEMERMKRERRKEVGRRYKLTKADAQLVRMRARHAELLAEKTSAYTRPRYHDLMATPLRRVAKKQFAARTVPVRKKSVKDKRTGKVRVEPVGTSMVSQVSGGLDWNRQIVPKVLRELDRAFAAREGVDKDLVVRMTAVVRTSEGERTVQAEAKFQARFNQIMTPQGLENYARLATYAAFAEELSLLGLVTQGSAKNIQRRSYNEDEDEEEWTQNEQGERWEKNEYGRVTIQAMNITVYEIE